MVFIPNLGEMWLLIPSGTFGGHPVFVTLSRSGFNQRGGVNHVFVAVVHCLAAVDWE